MKSLEASEEFVIGKNGIVLVGDNFKEHFYGMTFSMPKKSRHHFCPHHFSTMTDPIKAKIQKMCPDMVPNAKYLGTLPITLSVVLRAIYEANKNKKDEWGDRYRLQITDFGMFTGDITGAYYDWESEPIFWDLKKDNYDDQTEETKKFIGSLLEV